MASSHLGSSANSVPSMKPGSRLILPEGGDYGVVTLVRRNWREVVPVRSTKSLRTCRFHHVHRVTELSPFARIVCGKFDGWLRNSILEQDEGKLIVSIVFAFETEPPLPSVTGDFHSDLSCALRLSRFINNFLGIQNRHSSLISELDRNVVVEDVDRGIDADKYRT